jgi:DNA repair photolyase
MTRESETASLFASAAPALPDDYEPRQPKRLAVESIYLAKGSLATAERERFVRNIVALYPDAETIERLDTPHNQIRLGESDPVALHRTGKKTLVFGEHKSALRFSEEEGNACPNYWHFSPYGFCPYGCDYCYLAGTAGVWYSPAVRIYVNLPEIVREIDRTANRLATPTAFYLGKLQDGLALDPLTAYSTVLVPFFARHPFARQVLLTKSAQVDRLIGLEHAGHTVLSWSLNPPEVAREFESNTPPVEERVQAMKLCADAGYPVRVNLMPIIPIAGWGTVYADFMRQLLREVPLQHLTIGGICSYGQARWLMEQKRGDGNVISESMESGRSDDGRLRYPQELRIRMFGEIIAAVREVRDDLPIALCLEEPDVWDAVGLQPNRGRCNCVL